MHWLLRAPTRRVVPDDQRVVYGELRRAHGHATAAEALLKHWKDRGLKLCGEPCARAGQLSGVHLVNTAGSGVREPRSCARLHGSSCLRDQA